MPLLAREKGREMTGIERLRKLIADIDVSADPELWDILRWGTEGGWDCEERDGKTLGSTLAAIADQIKREQGEHVSRMRVLAVVTEMERHVSGVEGAEDSPVARWARELREALGGDGRDHAADVSVSAYDLLPQDDRDALAWVRDHGGLDHVRAEWRSRVPYDRYERRRQRLLGHIAECETALRRRREIISKLTHHVNALANENVELRRSAMPEGYEWPRYESGEPLRYEDRYVYDGREREVWHVDFDSYGQPTILNKDGTRFYPDKGERVKRPAAISEPVDTWERIEEDATLSPEVYCHRNGIDISQKDGTEIFLADTVEPMAPDCADVLRTIIRLAKLAERGE